MKKERKETKEFTVNSGTINPWMVATAILAIALVAIVIFFGISLLLSAISLFKMASGLGYQAVEMPAFSNNPHLDIEDVVKGNHAAELKKLLNSYGLIISALANHPEGQIVLGPYGKDTDASAPGPRRRRSNWHPAYDQDRPGGQRPRMSGSDRFHRLRELLVAFSHGHIPRAGQTWNRNSSNGGGRSSISLGNTG
jgi:hypothetical protein